MSIFSAVKRKVFDRKRLQYCKALRKNGLFMRFLKIAVF